jgi:hypothetical protein
VIPGLVDYTSLVAIRAAQQASHGTLEPSTQGTKTISKTCKRLSQVPSVIADVIIEFVHSSA